MSNGDIFSLGNDGSQCVAMQGNKPYRQGVVRLGTLDGNFTVSTWKTSYNRFRGILECRVIDGQLDPANCRAVNVEATRNLLAAAAASPRKPWFIYASSREVYGQQDDFPVREDADYRRDALQNLIARDHDFAICA